MEKISAEVIGKFESEGDANKLVYAPLKVPAKYRRTRVYMLEYEGKIDLAKDFVQRSLVDDYADEVFFTGEPAVQGFSFYIDYGMKPGALDLEKEAILSSHKGTGGFEIVSLKLVQRIYIFSDPSINSERFVRDICNPAIHVWSVTDSDGRKVA